MVSWSKQFTLEFIDVLKSLEGMWNMQHPEYHSTLARRTGYAVLLNKVREIDPNATVEDIKRKLKGLRTNLKKMERRVMAYEKCGLKHIPSLFYYEPLSFLLTQDRKRAALLAQSSKKNSKRNSESESVDYFEMLDDTQEEQNVTMRVNEDGSLSVEELPIDDSVELNNLENMPMELQAPKLSDPIGKKKPSSKDITEAEVFGKYVAFKLVSVSNLQRVYLEKIINDAIFEAELGNLTINSKLYKDNSDEQFYMSMNQTQNVNEVVIEEVQSVSERNENEILYEQVTKQNRGVYSEQRNFRVYSQKESTIKIEPGNEPNQNNARVVTECQTGTNLKPNRSLVSVKLEDNVVVANVTEEEMAISEETTQPNGVSFENVEFIDDSVVDQDEDEGITIIYVEGSESVGNL